MFIYFLYEFMAYPAFGDYSRRRVFDHAVKSAAENGSIVIAQQRYFDALRKRGGVPSVRCYEIPRQIDASLISESNDSWVDARIKAFTTPRAMLVEWLENVIEEIGEIDGFITFEPCKSLEAAAGPRNIPIIHRDSAPLRQPVYTPSLGCLDFKGTQGAANEASRRYRAFKKEKAAPLSNYILRPKEILALFLADEQKLEEFDQAPLYDWGIALSSDTSFNYTYNNSYSSNEFVLDASKNIDVSKSLIRAHPKEWFGVNLVHWQGAVDASPDTESFILQCERIALTWSKTAFLSMLWGKPTHIINSPDSAFSAGAVSTLDAADGGCADDDFVSFITFGYFVPLEFLDDSEYLKWRISGPAEADIYMRNISFLFAQKGLDLDAFVRAEDRVGYLLGCRGGAGQESGGRKGVSPLRWLRGILS